MTLFEYLSVAVSLVLALGLTHLLANLRAVVEPTRRYSVHALWVVYLLGHHSAAFTLDTYVHLLPGRRDFAAVDFGEGAASGHNEVTRPQIRARDDDRSLH
jgi:hypothetical protein